MVTCFSKVLDPEEFSTLEEFVAKCREAFVENWKLAHLNEDEAVEYEPPMGKQVPQYSAPVEPYKTNMMRLAVFVLCVFIYTATAPPTSPVLESPAF